jgi:hypothetical protein
MPVTASKFSHSVSLASRNQRPKRSLAFVFTFEAGDVTLMRLEATEITDGACEARTFCKVAGGVPVSFHPVLFQGKIIERNSSVAANGCFPARASAAGDKIS